jgi:mRNA-degrading endonuclease RelE of RelBE toxin-antitoxin system
VLGLLRFRGHPCSGHGQASRRIFYEQSLRNSRSAAKALAALPKADRVRVVETIDLLCDTPAPGSALLYEWQRSELVIPVVRVGHRREVYR